MLTVRYDARQTIDRILTDADTQKEDGFDAYAFDDQGRFVTEPRHLVDVKAGPLAPFAPPVPADPADPPARCSASSRPVWPSRVRPGPWTGRRCS